MTAPVFILAVSSYADTFAGMLSWEPRIAKDLASFFPPKGEVGGEATSTPSTASSPLFKDEVIANFDTRVLRAATGETVLLYGYWSPEVLLIAQNEAAFRLLTERLNTSKANR
jgi:hypothetical protein